MGYSNALSNGSSNTGGGGGIFELTADPTNPEVGSAWLLKTGSTSTPTLLAMFGGFPIVLQGVKSVFSLSIMTTEGIQRTTLKSATD